MKKHALSLTLFALLLVACASPTNDSPPSTVVATEQAIAVATAEPEPTVAVATAEPEPTEPPTATNTAVPEPTPTQTEPVATPTVAPTDEPLPTPTNIVRRTPTPQYEIGQELTDADITNIMYLMAERPATSAAQAIEVAAASGDERFIPVLIELLRFGQLNIVPWGYSQRTILPLQELSGERFGTNWGKWVEWYGGTDIVPPEGFTEWKGRLLAEIDPRFAEFFKSGSSATIRVEEVQWGGVILDGIPALDYATQIPAAEADYLTPEEPVFGIAINGEAHAYPLRIIDWHEMANDVVGGVPVSLAYCTLCGAAVAYHGTASDGNTYDFGSSGFLFRSNKLMYDRQTRTLWNQLTGEPVLGELVGTGVTLELLPVVLTSWDAWQAQHPETLVLDISTGFNRSYELGAAYGGYFAGDDTMFPVWQRSDLLDTKAQVYAIRVDGVPKAYPIAAVTAEQVINDTVNGTNLVVIGTRGAVDVVSVRGFEYRAGSEIRVYERGDVVFAPTDDPDVVISADNVTWQITEAELVAADGRTLPRFNGHLAYWFGWYAFFPNTELYGQ